MRSLTPAYAGGRSSGGTRALGLGGLGTRRQRFWFGLISLLALAVPYAVTLFAGIRADLTSPAPVVALPALEVPTARFLRIAIPGVDAAVKPVAPARAAAPARPVRRSTVAGPAGRRVVRTRTVSRTTGVRRAGVQRVRVTKESYSLLPAASVTGHGPGSSAAKRLATCPG